MNIKKIIVLVSLFSLTIGSMLGVEVTGFHYHCNLNHSGTQVKLKNNTTNSKFHFSHSTDCHYLPCTQNTATLEAGEEFTLNSAQHSCNWSSYPYQYYLGVSVEGNDAYLVPAGGYGFSREGKKAEEGKRLMQSYRVDRSKAAVEGAVDEHTEYQEVDGQLYAFHVKRSYNTEFQTLVFEIEMSEADSRDEL